MAGQAPSSLTVRMYNVGFGDCFLLSFGYRGKAKDSLLYRHVLVDFGSVSAPKVGATGDYMGRIAQDIAKVSGGKLEGIVVTHRHRDHISGFASDKKSGRTIASLKPNFVVQPWTEDPRAKPTAMTANAPDYTRGAPSPKALSTQFLGALEDMHAIAAGVKQASEDSRLAGGQMRKQLGILGENNLKNKSAVENLARMGQAGRAYYVNAGMNLNVLPGVKCTVLGPPNLKQSNAVRKERSRDADEFWQFRNFWGMQGLALAPAVRGSIRRSQPRRSEVPIDARWFVKQATQIQASQLLSIVRDLDSVMNNTSVILLLEIAGKRFLLPGDAQIENWSYALGNAQWRKALSDVDLYKVGHHGSLNATPKSLWALFKNKGSGAKRGRLQTLCSTKAGVYGKAKSNSEVPRKVLEAELRKSSTFFSSEDTGQALCHVTTINFS